MINIQYVFNITPFNFQICADLFKCMTRELLKKRKNSNFIWGNFIEAHKLLYWKSQLQYSNSNIYSLVEINIT